MTKFSTLFIILFILLGNIYAQKRYELLSIKYPPCDKNIKITAKPDTIVIPEDRLEGNYYIKLSIELKNISDSLLVLKKPGWSINTAGPCIIENGQYDIPCGISVNIFDKYDSSVAYNTSLAERAINIDNIEDYKDQLKKELAELDNKIAKDDSLYEIRRNSLNDVTLNKNDEYSFIIELPIHLIDISALSIVESYFDLEKNKVYSLIVYYSNEEYSFTEKDNLEYCAFSNTVTLIVE